MGNWTEIPVKGADLYGAADADVALAVQYNELVDAINERANAISEGAGAGPYTPLSHISQWDEMTLQHFADVEDEVRNSVPCFYRQDPGGGMSFGAWTWDAVCQAAFGQNDVTYPDPIWNPVSKAATPHAKQVNELRLIINRLWWFRSAADGVYVSSSSRSGRSEYEAESVPWSTLWTTAVEKWYSDGSMSNPNGSAYGEKESMYINAAPYWGWIRVARVKCTTYIYRYTIPAIGGTAYAVDFGAGNDWIAGSPPDKASVLFCGRRGLIDVPNHKYCTGPLAVTIPAGDHEITVSAFPPMIVPEDYEPPDPPSKYRDRTNGFYFVPPTSQWGNFYIKGNFTFYESTDVTLADGTTKVTTSGLEQIVTRVD